MNDIPLNFGIGQPVLRTEDPRLLTGRGDYTDDYSVSGQVFARFVRSQTANAALLSIDTTDALKMPGVLAIFTSADLRKDGIGDIPSNMPMKNRDGSPYYVPPRCGMAEGRVRHVGEIIAVVIAKTADQAEEAAENVKFELKAEAAAVEAWDAVKEGASQVWDEAENNVCLDFFIGDQDKCDEAFNKASHITKINVLSTRMVVNAMEPRSVVAEYDPLGEKFTVTLPTQGVMGMRAQLAKAIFKTDLEKVRILSNDVGGSFGMKGACLSEPIAVMYASKKLERPVKWTASRTESFLSDQQGRDSLIEAELALDAEGHFLGLRCSGLGNMGAYANAMGPGPVTGVISRNIISVYRTPAFAYGTKAVFSNTVPTGPYRGAGRPESKYILEQLIDKAARELGIDRIELRRRNLIPKDNFPWKAPNGQEYDSGEFEALMDECLRQADWEGFEARREEARSRGKLRGIAISPYLENTGAAGELCDVRFRSDGTIALITGAKDMGTSHRTPFAQILSDKLGVPYDLIEVIQNDSDIMSPGASGSGGSKTLLGAGNAINDCAMKISEKGKLVASHYLEAANEDIEFKNGIYTVAGTDRKISIMELASKLRAETDLPEGIPGSLDDKAVHDSSPSSFPNGCHVCEVEIDPETGESDIVRYTVVDDFGLVINPLVVEGQVQGGIMQGIGQVMMENTVYDDSGQLITGSYMDYCMPRAEDLCDINFSTRNVPATTNPLGVKGCGEAGNGGSMAASMCAILHALEPLGVTELDAPASPSRIWAAIQQAKR
jgi:carbon-monoxide dehydrogenase large subunit